MPDQNEVAAALGSSVYRAAWDAVMTGTEAAMLPDEQKEAVRLAREVTKTAAPGLPMPLDLDPTRPIHQAGPENPGGGDDVA